ncbi:MAG TPA: hypothetical protein VNZ22_09365 [Bacillota bacterium]|nr:hypothetical protein [Bacillota bacterium]
MDRLKHFGADNMLLDFGTQASNQRQQSEYLPPELMVALGRLGMGFIFAVIQLPHA